MGELDDRANCDSRETSSDDCRNVHVLIEQVPGEQIVEGGVCRLRVKHNVDFTPHGGGFRIRYLGGFYRLWGCYQLKQYV